MPTPHNLLYYSVNTSLSHNINTRYYNGSHYVWCSPIFDPSTLNNYHIWRSIPPSSTPKKIYYSYKEAIAGRDSHSPLIKQNRNGIIRGATFKFDEGIITEDELRIISRIVEKADYADFKPIVYLIPEAIIKTKIQLVPVDEAANPLSIEYRVTNLMEDEYEIIEP